VIAVIASVSLIGPPLIGFVQQAVGAFPTSFATTSPQRVVSGRRRDITTALSLSSTSRTQLSESFQRGLNAEGVFDLVEEAAV
jgi:hypothetical protein